MDHTNGYKLICKAYELHEKELVYEKWLNDMARYEMSFDEYYKKHLPYKKSTKEEKEEILKRYGG